MSGRTQSLAFFEEGDTAIIIKDLLGIAMQSQANFSSRPGAVLDEGLLASSTSQLHTSQTSRELTVRFGNRKGSSTLRDLQQ